VTHSASVKAAVLTGIALLLLVPLALLGSLVTERTAPLRTRGAPIECAEMQNDAGDSAAVTRTLKVPTSKSTVASM